MEVLKNSPHEFYKFNNGITMITSKIKEFNNSGFKSSFTITGANIINGQQTMIAIIDAFDALQKNGQKIPENAYVLTKIFTNINDNQLRALAMNTNQQKGIKLFELISTMRFNQNLQDQLIKRGIFYKPKTSKNDFTKQYKKWPQVNLKELLKYWYIKESKDVWIKNSIRKIMTIIYPNETIFKKSDHKLIASKFEKIVGLKDVEKFQKIALVIVILKKYKDRKDETIEIKYALDMYAYFLLLNKEKAQTKAFIDEFNKIVGRFTTQFMVHENKNIANAFKSKNKSEVLFKALEAFFSNLQF